MEQILKTVSFYRGNEVREIIEIWPLEREKALLLEKNSGGQWGFGNPPNISYLQNLEDKL